MYVDTCRAGTLLCKDPGMIFCALWTGGVAAANIFLAQTFVNTPPDSSLNCVSEIMYDS